MLVQHKRKLVAGVFAIVTLLCSAAVYADQSDFDTREQQQLRAHDFDVEHYRISLSIEESTNSFDGETDVTFSSTLDGLKKITLDSESFKVKRVTDEAGTLLEFIQSNGHLERYMINCGIKTCDIYNS